MSITRKAFDELMVLFTHNDNERFNRHTAGFISPASIRLEPLNDNKHYNDLGIFAIRHLQTSFDQFILGHSYQLITFIIDFNLGFSGNDACPLKQIKNWLEAKSQYNPYKLVKSFEEQLSTLQDGQIPFRFILTGGGGPNAIVDMHDLEEMNMKTALETYAYAGWALNKFMGVIRKPDSINASPVPRTPISTTRRLSRTASSTVSSASSSSIDPLANSLPTPRLPIAAKLSHSSSTMSSYSSSSTDLPTAAKLSHSTSAMSSSSSASLDSFASASPSPIPSPLGRETSAPASSPGISPVPALTALHTVIRSSSEVVAHTGVPTTPSLTPVRPILRSASESGVLNTESSSTPVTVFSLSHFFSNRAEGFFGDSNFHLSVQSQDVLPPVQEDSPPKDHKRDVSPPRERQRPAPITTPGNSPSRPTAPIDTDAELAETAARQLKF